MKVRERQAAASLGLPCRVKDFDCDVEMLSAADLESVSTGPEPCPFGSCQPEHVTYCIKMVEIAKMRKTCLDLDNGLFVCCRPFLLLLLTRITVSLVVDMYFAPKGPISTPEDERALNNVLEASIRSLPDDFREVIDGGNKSVWACLLHLAYK